MSTLIVEIARIHSVQPHSDPEVTRLETCKIKGWTLVVGKDTVKNGDLVVYIPPDAVLTESLHTFLGITKYLAALPKGYNLPIEKQHERPTSMRVRAASIRGESSYGVIMSAAQLTNYFSLVKNWAAEWKDYNGQLVPSFWNESVDISAILEIQKWEPPVKSTAGDTARDNSFFKKYTDIEHYGNYYRVLESNEPIVILEKLDGCLHKNSMILMANGKEKPIFKLATYDEIISYDENQKQFVIAVVNRVICQDIVKNQEWLELIFDNGRSLRCTADHKLLTTDGWVSAKDLTENHIFI